MKTNMVNTMIAAVAAGASSAFAATTGAGNDGSGPLLWFFIGFGVLVVMIQVVPSVILFVSMLRGLFSASDKAVHLPKV